jgi:hypothetical protein
MKAASAPASHSPIGYTQSAPASRYARARRRASGTRSPWAPARAREGRREEDIDPRVDHQPVALIGCRPADATQPYRLLGGIAQRRGGVVSVLEVAARCPHADENDPASARIRLHQRLGLRNIPDLIQAAVLDSALRAQVGGMRHFAASLEDLSGWPQRPRTIVILENKETGYAVTGDHPGVVPLPDHRRVTGGEPFREHHGRNRLIAAEQATGPVRHDPRTLAVGRRVRAVPRGRDHAPAVLDGHEVFVDWSCYSVVRSGKPVPNQ